MHYKNDESNFYCKIASITSTDVVDLDVYNLEVDIDNTYIANFILVHNCTANAITAAIEFDLMKENKQDFMPPRLFIYYNELEIEGRVDSAFGVQIRDTHLIIYIEVTSLAILLDEYLNAFSLSKVMILR